MQRSWRRSRLRQRDELAALVQEADPTVDSARGRELPLTPGFGTELCLGDLPAVGNTQAAFLGQPDRGKRR
jgi:hypothetical protein